MPGNSNVVVTGQVDIDSKNAQRSVEDLTTDFVELEKIIEKSQNKIKGLEASLKAVTIAGMTADISRLKSEISQLTSELSSWVNERDTIVRAINTRIDSGVGDNNTYITSTGRATIRAENKRSIQTMDSIDRAEKSILKATEQLNNILARTTSDLSQEKLSQLILGGAIRNSGSIMYGIDPNLMGKELEVALKRNIDAVQALIRDENKHEKEVAKEAVDRLIIYYKQNDDARAQAIKEYGDRQRAGTLDQMDITQRQAIGAVLRTRKEQNLDYAEMVRVAKGRLALDEQKRNDRHHLTKEQMMMSGITKTSQLLGSFKDPTGVTQTVSSIMGTATKAFVNPMVTLGEAAYKTGKAVVDLGNKSIEAYQSLEVIKTNLGVITGSNIEGNRLFGNIAEYAVKSPFGVQQTAEQATLLRQSGVYAADLMDTLKMVGDLAGGNADKMRRISNDYAQIVTNGKANMLQLRQFANAGIPIYRELSKELGVSNETIRKMVRQGKVGAEIIEKVLKNLTSEGGTFYQAVEKGSQTLKARTTNLEDIRTLAFSEIGRGMVDTGRNGSTEGILLKTLGLQEKFFNWVYDNVRENNDEKDLKNLDKTRQKYEQALKDYEKYSNVIDPVTNSYIVALEAKNRIAEYNYDIKSDRAQDVFFNAYKNRNNRIDTTTDYMSELEEQRYKLRKMLEGDLEEYERTYLKQLLSTYDFDYNQAQSKLTKTQNDMSPLYVQAASRSYFGSMYTSSSEILEKGAKGDKSLYTYTNQMVELQKSTNEWKEKELKEQIKAFENTQKIAQELSRMTSKIGEENILDVSKIRNVSDFRKYSQLLSQGDKFNLDQLAYNVSSAEDIKRANEENEKFQNALINALRIVNTADSKLRGTEDFNKLYGQLYGLRGRHFLNQGEQWNLAFTDYTNMLNKYSEGSSAQRDIAELFKSIVEPILSGDILGNLDALNVNINDITKPLEPLWKRILGSGLGLEASFIKTGGQALQIHEEEQYTRNITKALLGAGAKNGMNTFALTGMLTRSNKTKADKDDTYYKQIDWKATSKNFKNFALELGQAAEVTSAYREVVENDMNTLASLLASMPTTFEDAKNSKGFMDQFLNVYTGELKYNGQTAYYNAQSKMITDSNGSVVGAIYDVIDQISFAETTMQELSRQLEDRRKDLIEARRAEATNSVFEEGKKTFRESMYSYIAEVGMGFKSGSSQYNNFVKQGVISDSATTWESYNDWSERERKEVEEAKKEDATNIKRLEELNTLITEAKAGLANGTKDLEAKREEIKKKYEAEWLQKNGITLAEGQSVPTNMWPDIIAYYKSKDDYKSIQAEINKVSADLPGLKDKIAELTQELSSVSVTNKAAIVQQKQLQAHGITSATDVNDVLRNAFLIQYEPLLAKQDEDVKRIQAMLDMKDAALSIAYNKEDHRSGYFTDKYYNDIYGYSKYDVGGIIQGKSLETRAYLTSANGLQNAQNIDALMGDDTGTQLRYLALAGQTDTAEWNSLIEKVTEYQLMIEESEKRMKTLQDSLSDTWDSFFIDNFNESLRTTGKWLRELSEGTKENGQAWKDFGKNFVTATQNMTAKVGDLMITAGLKELIAGQTSIGIALLLAGGMNQIVSGFLNPKKDDDTDKKIETLKALKSDLKELIAQAKADAIYYEKEVSHKKALTTNKAMTNVNDAIITPSGNVINTHPDDWLIATKTPQTLGNTKTSAPVVNLSIVNNSGQQLSIKKTQTSSNGEVNIEAIIEGVVGQGIADGKFDGALAAREVRNAGRNVYM